MEKSSRKEQNFLAFFSSVPLAIMDASLPIVSKRDFRLNKDLHLVPDLDLYLPFLRDFFSKRPWTDNDVWLVGVRPGWVPEKARQLLGELEMDIDDEFYLYEKASGGGPTKIYEAYRISNGWPATIFEYGNWTEERGLKVSGLDMWQRRRDMQVGGGKAL